MIQRIFPFLLGGLDAHCAGIPGLHWEASRTMRGSEDAAGGLQDASLRFLCRYLSRYWPRLGASAPQPPPARPPGSAPWACQWRKLPGVPAQGTGSRDTSGSHAGADAIPPFPPAAAEGVYLPLCALFFPLSLFFSLGVGTPWVRAPGEAQLTRSLPP